MAEQTCDAPVKTDMSFFNDIIAKAQEKSRERAASGVVEESFPEVSPKAVITDENRELWLSAWGVPTRIRDNLGHDEFHDTEAIEYAKQFLKSGKEAWCMILSADKGAGKSTAAGYFLRESVWQPGKPSLKPPTYWRTGSGLARLSNYGPEWESVIKSRFMVIDDMGMEYLDKNGNLLTKLDEIFYYRHGEYLKTFITTNLNRDDFVYRYGERIVDRVREGVPHGGGFFGINRKSMRSR